jgi:formylglycine-generating enzyme required for sulfatase activity
VIDVSWDDAVDYAQWLSELTGKEYRLPTEAEWEYAARAGTTTVYWWGEEVGSNKANCSDCDNQWDGRQPAPVGSFEPNAFGLYDTAGNVWEWTCSEYREKYYETEEKKCDTKKNSAKNMTASRVERGGSWYSGSRYVRSATRNKVDHDSRNYFLGFRLARSL